ncbi:haloacid dehalogenase type II [Thalassospiraceae bacterium LMO-JJ14]|nr:haloacid dehalogenase type II [Thalassospiraceae bacterium LMO-JJ14]
MAAIDNIDACVFDAYGTLFDVAAAASHCQEELGDKWAPLAQTWREKQLQYTWLRSLMHEYVPFWQITQDSLDYALALHGVENADLRQKLLDIYFELDAYPEVPSVLAVLKAGGKKVATLSNGSPDMLNAAVNNAKLDLDAVSSVDRIGIYKPDPRIYQMSCDDLDVPKERICFMSSNAWDAWAAANFGFQVVWVNRFNQPPERLPGEIREMISDLNGLPPLLGL